MFERPLPFQNPETKSAVLHLQHSGAWGVFLDRSRIRSQAEERSILAHECGHCATGTTHRADSPLDVVARHENRADKWAVRHLVPAEELDEAVSRGYIELWELAEYFNVTEDLMRKAVRWYTGGNLDE